MKFKTPKYSQFLDVEDKEWKNKSCGILSLKMLLDYWNHKEETSAEDVENLITEGLAADAYVPEVGWKHRELVNLSQNHGLDGENFDWAHEHPDVAFNRVMPHLSKHPVMVSIHKDLSEDGPGHLAVLTGFEDGRVFYNDPDAKSREDIERSVPLQKFLNGWKRRMVVIHPKECTCNK